MGNCQTISEKDIAEAMTKSPPQIVLKAETWTKDSYGLFDYVCKDLIRNTHTSNGGIILRREGDSIAKEDEETVQFYPEEELLCDFEPENGIFYMKPRGWYDRHHKGNDHRAMWKAVRFCKEKGVTGARVIQGDILKLGRVAFKIRELTLSNKRGEDTEGVPEMIDIDYYDKEKGYEDVGEKEKFCRICFVPDEEEDNPLFCPCDCSGSMRYIHFSCLKQWLNNRMTGRSTNFSYTFNLKNLECELCKVNLPERFKFRGKCFSFLEFPKFAPPYVIFDILRKESKKTRGVHILKLNYKPNITIGRGSGNDIRMNDISVSRNHAEFKLTTHGMFIEDKSSKFGTLILVRDQVAVTQFTNNQSYQIGRSLINVSVKCKWKFAMKMNEHNEKIKDNYEAGVPKSSLQFKYDHVKTDDENIIEIADSDEDSENSDDDEEEEEADPSPEGVDGELGPEEEENLIQGEQDQLEIAPVSGVQVEGNPPVGGPVEGNPPVGGPVEGVPLVGPEGPVQQPAEGQNLAAPEPRPHEDSHTDESFSEHQNSNVENTGNPGLQPQQTGVFTDEAPLT